MSSTCITTTPTARVRHTCYLCRRAVQPGEMYYRLTTLDDGTAYTSKMCEHCQRVAHRYCVAFGTDEWFPEDVWEWVEDEHTALACDMAAGWRYPDGGLMPPPFPAHCYTCGTPVAYGHLWCDPCEDARIADLNKQFESLTEAFAKERP